ncbi:Pfs, NACHT, and ankyrin domain protein [Trichoderma evansii]
MSFPRELPFYNQNGAVSEISPSNEKRAWGEDNAESCFSGSAKRQRTAIGNAVYNRIPRLQYSDYTVGWICALHIEMAAARAMLDGIHESLPTALNDSNAYTLGNIGAHNIVIACLPASYYGANNAANVASNMDRSFPSIRVRLMVGIGGGVPGNIDLRLGDIVVGCKVVQYDLGKVIGNGQIERTGIPWKPRPELLNHISLLRSIHESKPSRVPSILQEMQDKQPEMAKYAHSIFLQDRLFSADYDHDPISPNCDGCDASKLVCRPPRANHHPQIHYGGIASGNQVMKHGITRDIIAQELGVICFEMEAAGLMDHFPCLVIRGICDYSDSHKNKEWQEYSAASAAAYAREFLEAMPTPTATRGTIVDSRGALTENQEAGNCRRDLFLTDPSEDRKSLKRKKGDRARGTCEWILETKELSAWLSSGQTACSESQTTNLLWLHGNPGTGKSTMAIFLAEELSKAFSVTDGKTLAYFSCDSSFDKRKTATSVLRGLLHQLIQQHSQLLDYLLPKYNERGAELFKSFDGLWTIFMAAAADQNTGQKYCIIDALDECDLESQKILLRQFQETFQGQDAPPNIRILITSRPYSEIFEYLEEFANQDLASFPQAKQDIDLCIEERVVGLAKKKKYTEKVKQQVSDILREKAEGTFLWVGLVCKELEDVPSKNAIQVLRIMPKGLHSLYKRLLDTAIEQEESGADIVRRILSLVAVCMRPLSVLDLSQACQLYQEEVDIDTRIQFTRDQIASCRLMIIIQDEKVLLLHQSVRDYLVGANSSYFINELEAHADIAYRCVNLLIERFHSRELSHIHFLSYAAQDWFNHAHMAQSRFEVRDSEVEFFRVNSPSREHWIETLRSKYYGYFYDIPQQFSILHVAGRWGIAPLVDYIANQNYRDSNTKKIKPVIDVNCVDQENETAIEQAVGSGHIRVTSKLLCLGAKVNDATVVAAAENRNGKEIMALLLDQRGDQVTITEEVVKAAAGNWRDGKKVMALLLDQRGDQVIITEEVVKAAARNLSCGREVMAFLLDRREDQITITKEVVKAAAGNWESGKEVITLLLDRRGDQVIITEGIVSAIAAGFDKKVIALLLNKQGNQVTITEEVVKAAAGNWKNGKEIMALLLDRRGDQVTITEEVVKAAAKNRNGKQVIALLLDQRGDQVTITEKIVKAAAENRNGEEVIALLLDRRGDQVTITEEIIKVAAGNEVNGEGIMTLLLNRRGDHRITITEEVVKAAATCGQDAVLNLLSQQNSIISDWDKWHRISKFYKAARAGDIHCIKQLIHEGINPDMKNIKGETPLWIAAANGREAIVKNLAQRTDVDVNSMSISGRSPLFWPSWRGYERVVAILMEAGADPRYADMDGNTAVIVAKQNGHERVARILERVG